MGNWMTMKADSCVCRFLEMSCDKPAELPEQGIVFAKHVRTCFTGLMGLPISKLEARPMYVHATSLARAHPPNWSTVHRDAYRISHISFARHTGLNADCNISN